jgi:hypothetical protein
MDGLTLSVLSGGIIVAIQATNYVADGISSFILSLF